MSLISVSYTSTATAGITLDKLKEIVSLAVEFNTQNNITGYLCAIEENGSITGFIQWIEGEPDSIDLCLTRINASTSHENIILKHKSSADKRKFPNWVLQYETVNSIAMKIFMQNM